MGYILCKLKLIPDNRWGHQKKTIKLNKNKFFLVYLSITLYKISVYINFYQGLKCYGRQQVHIKKNTEWLNKSFW